MAKSLKNDTKSALSQFARFVEPQTITLSDDVPPAPRRAREIHCRAQVKICRIHVSTVFEKDTLQEKNWTFLKNF